MKMIDTFSYQTSVISRVCRQVWTLIILLVLYISYYPFEEIWRIAVVSGPCSLFWMNNRTSHISTIHMKVLRLNIDLRAPVSTFRVPLLVQDLFPCYRSSTSLCVVSIITSRDIIAAYTTSPQAPNTSHVRESCPSPLFAVPILSPLPRRPNTTDSLHKACHKQ
jgi:hypothetical protein